MRTALSVLSAALVAGLTASALSFPASAAADQFTPAGPGASCSTPNSLTRQTSFDASGAAQGVVKVKSRTINFKASNWKAYVPSDPTITQFFHSAAWLMPVLRTNEELAVSLLLDQYRTRPDTGSATKEERVGSGWSESQVTKRMWTVLCVLDRTRDARLVPVLEQLASANMDPDRYYGPPNRPAHNHGTFANEVLAAASSYLDRPEWRDVALKRFRLMLDETFESCGMAYEQSATYHALNVRLWTRILEKFPSLGSDELLRGPREALAALARPDAYIDPIGDGFHGVYDADALEALNVTPGGSVWCSKTGWLADHEDIGGATSHVVARFGPKMNLHGDTDHTSLTWWVGSGSVGNSVLTERGLFSKQVTPRLAFVNSDAAHSVLSRTGAQFTAATTGTRLVNRGMSSAKFTTKQPDGTRTRVLSYASSAPVLAVSDTVTGSKAGSGFVQYWQLAPQWMPTTGHTARTADGNTLDIVCFVNGKRAKVSLKKVEHFPAAESASTAYTASCRAGAATSVRFDTAVVVDSDVSVAPGVVSTKYGKFAVSASGLWSPR